MANPIKYNTSAETLALKKGNFWIGTGDVGKGPTSSTGFYNGIEPPTGGFTIYLNKASGGPSIYTVSNESQLTGLTNTLSVSTNLIKNNNGGNFANGTLAPFNGSYGTLPTVVDISNDRPYNGSISTKAAKFVTGGGMSIYSDPSPFTMTVGVTYTFSFWYKLANSNQTDIYFQNQGGSGDMNGNFLASSSNYFAKPTQTWQRCSWTFTNVVNKIYFIIALTNSSAGSELLTTEFTLTEGSMPGGPGLTTSGNCLNWFSTQTDKMIFNRDYPPIVTNGLTLNLDAGFSPSFATIPSNANSSTVTPWYDVSPNGNNGTLTNGPTFNSENGCSIVLDGIDDYISLSSSVLFGGNDRTFTLMMWVYGQPNPNAFSGFLRINGTLLFYSPSSATVGSNPGSYRLAYPYPSTSYMSISLPINSWYLLTLTNLDSQTPSYQGYSLNGAALTTTTYTGRIEPYEIRIGMADAYINGKVGNVLAYNRVLSNTEIKQNYNAIIQRYNLYANPLSVFKSNLTLWLDTSLPTATSNTTNYNTIDTTGTVSFSRIYDMSGNGNHASQINKNRQPTLGTTSNSKNISISDGSKGFALNNISNGQRTIYIVHKNSSLSMGRGGASNGYVLQGTSFYGYSPQFNFVPYNNQVRCNLPSPAANNQLQITILVSFSDRTEAYTTTNNGTITSSTTVMKNNYFLGDNSLNYLTNSDSYYQVGMFCRNLGGDNNIDSFEAGEFAEMIVVNRISTADEIATTQNYLYNKWFN